MPKLLLPMGSFLESIAAPIVRKVLVSLGFGIVTFGVITTTLNQLLSIAQSNYSSITGIASSLLAIAGAGEAMGIIAAALVFRATFMSGKALRLVS
ncbi:DUF2523 domain-containing protein [Nitrosomonas sp.]|uniref:DUF2523 domain-containing protein n=1 Tax=Nitrosomonas sp. TaxID=42353 RepID=UPI001DCA72E8|nr:DUF2523 domain-containing protein [Nitrosomonas sp.]MBX3617493.1 DUF2523 domain-containing protein [Nitrosomonas sp.]